MNAKHTPQPNFFVAMGWFNMVVATRDFAGITDRGVLDKLKNSQPICHENGEPYDLTDFLKLYVGLLEPSQAFSNAAEITQEDVDYWQSEIRIAFKEIVKDQCRYPKEVWSDVKAELASLGISLEEIEWCQEMVFELRNATADEARRQRQKYQGMPLLEALITVAGGNHERLGKLRIWLSGKAKHFPESFPRAVDGLTKEQLSVLDDSKKVFHLGLGESFATNI